MISRRVGLRFSAAAGVAAALFACGTQISAAKGSAHGARAQQTVRIIQAGGADFSGVDLYKAIQILQKEGIKATVSSIDDPASAVRALVANQGDVYMDAPSQAALAVANGGANIKYIATQYQSSGYVLLAKPNLTLHNLSGTSLAIASPGSAGQVAALAALTKLGINTSSIHQVTVGGTSARVTAILAGQVDLAPALAPAAVPAVATGKVKILVNTGKVLNPFVQQGLIANANFLKKASLAQTVVNAFIDAERWSATNEAGYIKLGAQEKLNAGLTPAEQKTSWTQLKQGHFWATNGALCQTDISATLNYYYKSNTLTKSQMPKKQSSWLDPSFVRAYLLEHHESQNAC